MLFGVLPRFIIIISRFYLLVDMTSFYLCHYFGGLKKKRINVIFIIVDKRRLRYISIFKFTIFTYIFICVFQ